MSLSRRQFMGRSGAAIIGGTMASTAVFGANERVNMAVIGFHGRGGEHIESWCENPNSQLVALCDVDQKVLDGGVAAASKKTGKAVKGYKDMRELFADKSVDAVSIATPNHWHTLAAIWAIQAGKDVYVEKPCSHNLWEGRQLVNAAKKYNKIVQHGTQIRSSEAIREAMQKIQEGLLGDVYMTRGTCYKRRASIGKKPDGPVPDGVDFNMWLGPIAERPFNENKFHYNWHWQYDTGNSDLGNQGVHQMDIARWALGVKLPKKVSGLGGKYLFDDDKGTPNSMTTAFHYPDEGKMGKQLVFEVRPWHTNDEGGAKIGAIVYGSEGYMVIPSYSKYQTFLGDKGEPGPSADKGGDHWDNFLAAVKARDASILHAPIEEGHYSSALCHLGLLSVRLGRSFNFDPEKEQIIGDDEANSMLTIKYRDPFVVPAIEA